MHVGPYEILGALGAGGMGEVYRARDTRLNRDVALKVLPEIFARDPERMARFEREAQVLASLNHPNIAQLYGLEERALVMEYVPGETLKGPLALEEAIPLVRQIAEALEYAHERGIIHRDLKPANIKITPEGKVKILDFGLAKALDDHPTGTDAANSPTISLAATRAGVILGTAAYMAPEQAKGKAVDRRADIWSFGVVLAEMLTGRQMYTGETAAETLASVMRDEPRLPEAPGAIRELLLRCLDRDPRTRLQAIGEARIILEAPPAPQEPAANTQHPRPNTRLPWAVAAVFLIVAAVLAAIHFREPAPEVRKLFLPPPDKTRFFGAMALSPDGRRLAFAATDSSGKQQLWVRSLDSLTAQQLAGTEGASRPSWSPDGRFVVFGADSKLKKIDVTGGAPQNLCPAPGNFEGAAWNRDGVIVFGTTGLRALHRVAATGGESRPVTTLDPSLKEQRHGWPVFLPDGRRFLYLSFGSERAIYAGDLESPLRKRVVATHSAAAYAPGFLLYLRESTLLAQPFDAGKLEMRGDPVPVAEQVGYFQVAGEAYFSVAGAGALVYGSGTHVARRQPTWMDRAGKPLGTVGEPAVYSWITLSPEGKRLALERTDPMGLSSTDIWLFDLNRGASRRFTFDPTSDRSPVWSPDGSRIAFTSIRGGIYDLYWKVSSGAGQDELLLKSGESKYPDDWSADGKLLLYEQADPKTRVDLWVLPLQGERKPVPFLQTEFSERQGRFSPDGRWIAYSSDESGRYEVYVQPYPPTGAKWMISRDGGGRPEWRRDGKEIFFLGDPHQQLLSVDVKLPSGGSGGGVEAGVPRVLFPVAFGTSAYAVSADGQRFLMNAPIQDAAGAQPATVVLNWAASPR
jgi:Tol biopolymer transport system component/predicted Ser/Thr protein kinase